MIQQIAQETATEFNRSVKDLRKKRYSKLSNILEMKREFVKRCYDNDISNARIADFLDHGIQAVSRLYSKAVGGITHKHERILHHMELHGKVTEDEFTALKGHVSYLRSKGYNIWRDGNEFKLG